MHIHSLLPLLTPIQRQCCCWHSYSPNTLHFLLFSLGMLTPPVTYLVQSPHNLLHIPTRCLTLLVFSSLFFSILLIIVPTENPHNSISPTEHTNGISAFFSHWYIPRPKIVLGILKVCNKCWKYHFYVTSIFFFKFASTFEFEQFCFWSDQFAKFTGCLFHCFLLCEFKPCSLVVESGVTKHTAE